MTKTGDVMKHELAIATWASLSRRFICTSCSNYDCINRNRINRYRINSNKPAYIHP